MEKSICNEADEFIVYPMLYHDMILYHDVNHNKEIRQIEK